MKYRLACFLILPFLPAPSAAPAELPDLIPREALFGNPVRSAPILSPDGKRLAFLAPTENGVMNIWIQTIGRSEAAPITRYEGRGVGSYLLNWAFDSRNILFLRDEKGDEAFHVFIVDTATKTIRDLTPYPGVKTNKYALARNHPAEMLAALNLRDPKIYDIFRIRLDTGALDFEVRIPGNISDWTADGNLVVRAANGIDLKDGSSVLMVRDGRDLPWRDLLKLPFGEKGRFIAFKPGGTTAIIESSLGSDTSRLVEIDLQTGRISRTVFGHDQCDLDSVLIDPLTGEAQAVFTEYLRPEWTVLDKGVEADFDLLRKFRPDAFSILDRDLEDRKWLVDYWSDANPGTYALYDRVKRNVEILFESRPDLSRYRLAAVKPELISAGDGLKLVSYLTLPVGITPARLPLVLWVHGGPWARDSWGFERFAQLLANRGYAVLQVNFRGSDGFGKKFLNAGNREWGVGGMQRDLTDAVHWAVGKGIADPDRIAILGLSYGGYAVLAGLAFTPELYACGVDICGPCDVNGMLNSLRGPRRPVFLKRIGDVESDPEFNRRISPLYHAHKIKAPVLIGQGKNDPRVRIEEADRMARALEEAQVRVTYVVYGDEGHTFQRPENNLDFWGRIEEFLGRHLGGRIEPFRPVSGSSAEIRIQR